jgi:hypothetical protein
VIWALAEISNAGGINCSSITFLKSISGANPEILSNVVWMRRIGFEWAGKTLSKLLTIRFSECRPVSRSLLQMVGRRPSSKRRVEAVQSGGDGCRIGYSLGASLFAKPNLQSSRSSFYSWGIKCSSRHLAISLPQQYPRIKPSSITFSPISSSEPPRALPIMRRLTLQPTNSTPTLKTPNPSPISTNLTELASRRRIRI